MSWQAYVDDSFVRDSQGKVSKAAILGQQGGIWAKSANLAISDSEVAHIIGIFKNPDSAWGSGVTIAGTKYFAVQVSDKLFMGKKGPDGCVIYKTTQAVVVTLHSAPTQLPESLAFVEGVCERYLIATGY